MISVSGAYVSVVLSLAVSAAIALAGEVWRSRCLRRWRKREEPTALRIIMRTIIAPPRDGRPVRIPKMPRRALSLTLLNLCISTYNVDRRAISSLTRAYGARRIIGRLSPLTGGYRRAERLLMLACMPTGRRIPHRRGGRRSSVARCVRFYTLLAEMARTPSLAEYLVETYDARLSLAEISQIVGMLHRGTIVLDYRRMLRSDNHNLRMTGIAVVQHFSIDEACGSLLDIVAGDPDPEICREALMTLCSTGCDITRADVARRMASMQTWQRHSLCRYAVLHGYAFESVAPLLAAADCDYLETLVESHKYTIT